MNVLVIATWYVNFRFRIICIKGAVSYGKYSFAVFDLHPNVYVTYKG